MTPYTTGMTNVAEFMASGWPFAKQVTAGETVQFPWVTSEIYIVTAGTAATFGFSPSITSSLNLIVVPPSTSLTMKVKIKSLYTTGSGSFYVGAALTNIMPGQYPTLVSGSSVYYNPNDDSGNKIYPGV